MRIGTVVEHRSLFSARYDNRRARKSPHSSPTRFVGGTFRASEGTREKILGKITASKDEAKLKSHWHDADDPHFLNHYGEMILLLRQAHILREALQAVRPVQSRYEGVSQLFESLRQVKINTIDRLIEMGVFLLATQYQEQTASGIYEEVDDYTLFLQPDSRLCFQRVLTALTKSSQNLLTLSVGLGNAELHHTHQEMMQMIDGVEPRRQPFRILRDEAIANDDVLSEPITTYLNLVLAEMDRFETEVAAAIRTYGSGSLTRDPKGALSRMHDQYERVYAIASMLVMETDAFLEAFGK